MRVRALAAIALLWLGMGLGVSAQSGPSQSESSQSGSSQSGSSQSGSSKTHAHRNHVTPETVSADDGLSIIASALDPAVKRYAGHDCSHLVHAIYQRAGYSYVYANSDALYDGVAGFRRVSRPQPGDVIVWHEHTGIVVRPSRHVFFSFMSNGPGIDDYESKYWRTRGHPRFYRYIRTTSCSQCASVSQSLP